MKSFSRSFVAVALGMFLGCSFHTNSAMAVNDWYLLSGTSTSSTPGTYPDQHGQTGRPGARQQAVTWTDSTGCLWMYGGRGYAQGPSGPSTLSDIWKYDPNIGTWYWMGGSKTTSSKAVYPTAVGDPGEPGGRYGATSWQDAQGNIWVFGGYGEPAAGNAGYMSDMWKFNMQTLVWTYEGGPQAAFDPGQYVIPHTTGQPASRISGAGAVTPAGEFLLFGGNSQPGRRNDLWKFAPAPRTWTWIGGTAAIGASGLYPPFHGQEGFPGARAGMATWVNGPDFWIFGGFGETASSVGTISDIWKYDIATNRFYWMNGSSSPSHNTVYPDHGLVGTMGSRNAPCFWNGGGKFWLSGGYGPGNSTVARFNDLWSFHPGENQWRFIDGPKGETVGTYPAPGLKGVPTGRMFGLTWTVGNRMYLFGGTPDGSSVMSDFWMHYTEPLSGIEDWQLLED